MNITIQFDDRKQHDEYCLAVAGGISALQMCDKGTSTEKPPTAAKKPKTKPKTKTTKPDPLVEQTATPEADPLALDGGVETETIDEDFGLTDAPTAIPSLDDIAGLTKEIVATQNVKGKTAVRALLDDIGAAGIKSIPEEQRAAFYEELKKLRVRG